MKLEIRNQCSEFESYRAARVKSLFNCESGANFNLDAELPIEGNDWQIGLIVGPSGSGKTSMGKAIFGPRAFANLSARWPSDQPIIDAISPRGSFDEVAAALSTVGLGSVPAWLRPFKALSNGEQFRAGLARLICAPPAQVVVDEWTSVIDRQIARIGSLAFAKAWRRKAGQAVLLSCHYDVAEWLQPDWVFDTATGKFTGACLWRRPTIDLELRETNWRYWPLFEPHYYLTLPHMIAATCFVGTVEGQPVCHAAVGPRFEIGYMRASRLVVMPEWQGAGLGVRFLNAVCQLQLEGGNRWGRKISTLFRTSHPGLCAALRRDKHWVQVSALLHGGNKASSSASIQASAIRKQRPGAQTITAGYGGHFRAIQGFKYVGEQCAS